MHWLTTALDLGVGRVGRWVGGVKYGGFRDYYVQSYKYTFEAVGCNSNKRMSELLSKFPRNIPIKIDILPIICYI